MIERLPEALKKLILDCYNNFLRLRQYPTSWTEHLVYLLSKEDTGKFRHITLAPCFFKLMERIMVDRTTWWLEHNSKLPDTQFGFRAGKSTADNLSVVTGEIYTGFAQGEYTLSSLYRLYYILSLRVIPF